QMVAELVDPPHVAQLQVAGLNVPLLGGPLQPGKDADGDHHNDKGHHHRPVEADADDQADAGGGPQPGSGGQPRHLGVVPGEDGTRPQKADAGDDLGADTQGVVGEAQNVSGVEAHHGRHGGSQADQNMGSQPGGPALAAPLGAYRAAHQGGQQQAEKDGPG